MHPGERVGRYELVRELGRGGMGVVWEARDPDLPGRRLALKLVHADLIEPESLLRFLREAELMAQVRHAAVVTIHATGQDAGGPYLVTDLVEGQSLAEVVERGGLEPARATELVAELCAAAETLHARGIVHRDLKPANVILRPDGRPVLLDFGLARELDRDSLTRTGEVLGTPAFMAPEQVCDPRGVDRRADVYALGGVLYALLRGRAPFTGALVHVLEAVLRRGPEWPACADPALDAICRRAMALDPAARYASAGELNVALREWSAGRGAAPWSPARLALVLGGAVLAVLTAAVWALRPAEQPRIAEPSSPAALASSEAADQGATKGASASLPGEPRLLALTRSVEGLTGVAHLGSQVLLRDRRGLLLWQPGQEPQRACDLRPWVGGADQIPPLVVEPAMGMGTTVAGVTAVGLWLNDLQRERWKWAADGQARSIVSHPAGGVIVASMKYVRHLVHADHEPETKAMGGAQAYVVLGLVKERGGERLWLLRRRDPDVDAQVEVQEIPMSPDAMLLPDGRVTRLPNGPTCWAEGEQELVLGYPDGTVCSQSSRWELEGGPALRTLLRARGPTVWAAALDRGSSLALARIDLTGPSGKVTPWRCAQLPQLETKPPALGLSLSPDETELAVSGNGWVAVFALPTD